MPVAGLLNEDDMPQLRLSPTYRRLLARDAADRDVRNYVKERFTARFTFEKYRATQAHDFGALQSIIARQGDFWTTGRTPEAHDVRKLRKKWECILRP